MARRSTLDLTIERYTTAHLSCVERASIEAQLQHFLYSFNNKIYELHKVLTPAHPILGDVVMMIEQVATGQDYSGWPELRGKLVLRSLGAKKSPPGDSRAGHFMAS